MKVIGPCHSNHMKMVGTGHSPSWDVNGAANHMKVIGVVRSFIRSFIRLFIRSFIRSFIAMYSSRQTRFSSYVHGKPSNGNRKKCTFLVFKLFIPFQADALVFTSGFLKLRIITIPNLNHFSSFLLLCKNKHAVQTNHWRRKKKGGRNNMATKLVR